MTGLTTYVVEGEAEFEPDPIQGLQQTRGQKGGCGKGERQAERP